MQWKAKDGELKTKLQNIPAWVGTSSALVFIWLAFSHNLLSTENSFAIFMDNEFFLAPVLSYMSSALSHGEWPLWMNTVLGGVPLYNFAQMSPFYPLYFAGFPIFEGPFDAMRSMHLITLGHLLLFVVNTYLLLRTLRISRLASFAGVVLVVFNANNLGYATWVNIVAPYAWFPLYVAGLIKLLEAPTSVRAVLVTLLSIVMLTLASPAQPLIHAVFVTAVLVAFHAVRLRRSNDMASLRKGLLVLCGVAVIALLLASPVLIPVVTEFKDMVRWIGPFPAVYGNARIPFQAFLIDQVAIGDLPGVIFRLDSRQAIGSIFVGILPIALAVVAFSRRHSNWVVWPLVFIACYSLASAAGSNLGFAYLNYILPLINKIREPSRFLFLFHFSIGVLAAIGIDRLGQLIRDSNTARAGFRPLWSMVGVLGLGLLVAAISWQHTDKHWGIVAAVLVISAMMAITAIAAAQRWSSKSRLIVAGWAVAVIVMQWILVPWTAPPVSSSNYLSGNMISLDAALKRVAEKDPQHEYRVIFDGKIDKQQAAMLASYQGLRTLNSYFNPAPRKQFEELYYHGPRKDNYVRALGAKYLICQDCGADALVGYAHAVDVAGYSIYEASDVLPHTYIAHGVDGEFRDLGEYASKISTLNLSRPPLFIEPGTLALGYRKPGDASPACLQQTLHRDLNRLKFIIKCDRDGVFVLNEFFTSAWVVSVDGKRQAALQVNGNQIGVHFGAGSHVIEFKYSPQIFKIGIALLMLGVLALFVFLYFIRRIETSTEIELNLRQGVAK
jgi:uncharacterized membrane protein (UPF0136 family)